MKNKSLINQFYNQRKNNFAYVQQVCQHSQQLLNQYQNCHSVITHIKSNLEKINNDENKLAYVPYSLKDNVSTKGILTTAGSKFLANYFPQFNATVYQHLNDAHAHLISKDNMDEYGLGGTGCYSAYGQVYNPLNPIYGTAGSSSGSAVNVAIGASYFAIGTDTGDSIRRPASYCGIVGYKPSYGLISRFGVIPYAPTLDHVGILAKYVMDVRIVANQICQYDEKDMTSYPKKINFEQDFALPSKIKFVVYKNMFNYLEPKYLQSFQKLLHKLTSLGHEIIEVNFDENLLQFLAFVYKTISYVEAYSCHSNLQGITFGNNVDGAEEKNFLERIFLNRTSNFGQELKRRFLLGSHLSNKENFQTIVHKAKQLRTLINRQQQAHLQQGDCILMPTTQTTAIKHCDIQKWSSLYDDLLMCQNFLGNPSIALPYDQIDSMPWSIMVATNNYQDQKCLTIAQYLENILGDENE